MGWSERNVVVDVTSTIDDDEDDSETIYIYVCVTCSARKITEKETDRGCVNFANATIYVYILCGLCIYTAL